MRPELGGGVVISESEARERELGVFRGLIVGLPLALAVLAAWVLIVAHLISRAT